MQSSSTHALFQPLKVGRMQLAHRVAMAPLTRFRANKDHVLGDMGVEYYSQRASVPGTLLVSEATFISPQAGGYDNVPGIYTAEQIVAWKRITDAVHAKGSFIYLQLWALGRTANADVLTKEGGLPLVSASNKPVEGGEIPRPLTVPEIQQYVQDYAQAARNAVKAGFDGVEIHGANGYLLDQFLQDVTNERTDEYGGSIERRSRFTLEVIKTVSDAIGADRTGIRLSPWAIIQGMGMVDPVPQFLHLINSFRENHPDLAYIHVIQPSIENGQRNPGSNEAFRDAWAPRPFLSADGHDLESALNDSAQYGDVIVFGRHFIANPDLPRRLKERIPLNPYDRQTFFTPELAAGYTDYRFAEEQQEVGPQAHL